MNVFRSTSSLRRLLPVGLLLISSTVALAQAPVTPPAAPPAAPAPAAADQFPDSPGAASNARPPAVPNGPTVVIDTSMGRMTCQLFGRDAPVTSANFVGLVTGTKEFTDPVTGKKVKGKSFYDGTTFHRVIPGFMIQGGDRKGDGTGDGGFYFDQEIVPGLNFDVPGRMAMANSGPNTNGTQFFITELPQPDLDGKYNIFGQCDEHSVLIVASIARVDRTSDDKPVTPVVIQHITVLKDGDPMPPMPPAPAPAPAAASPVVPPVK